METGNATFLVLYIRNLLVYMMFLLAFPRSVSSNVPAFPLPMARQNLWCNSSSSFSSSKNSAVVSPLYLHYPSFAACCSGGMMFLLM